jgi:uncharacterized protein
MDIFSPGDLPDAMDALQRARCHGALTGFVCTGQDPRHAAERALSQAPGLDLHVLEPWAEAIRSGLRASDLSFRLCLPDDEQPLPRRMEALAAWCREFLSALGEGGERLEKLGDDARDTLRELEIIGQGANVGEDDEEAEELMLAELGEHVRLSALFLYQALNPPAAPVAQ